MSQSHRNPLSLSVAICTRNPRMEYLGLVLEALRVQTLPLDYWELILVDNGSSPPVSVDLSWHPNARIVVEPETGVLPARLTAIRESKAKVLCSIDDDTRPTADYLETGLKIAGSHTWLGAWGAAKVIGQFEVPVPPWAGPFLHMLALRDEQGTYWSNMQDWRTIPYSCGMFYRREIGDGFIKWVQENRHARLLGRKGEGLLAHEDIALARMAYQLHLGTGIFESLRLDHFIPKRRLELEYLTRLSEGFAYSGVLDKWINGQNYRPINKGRINNLIERIRIARKTPEARACWLAARRGTRAALKFIEEQNQMQAAPSAAAT